MANSLLDFVMSVVRDPDAAAHYAANPTQAIADANLGDVTSADVNNLIPVVTESLSSVLPSTGADTLGDHAGNVWASGAATAAFDAFDDHLPIQGGDVIADHVPTVAGFIDQPADAAPVIDDGFTDGIDNAVPSVAIHDPSAPVSVDDVQLPDHAPIDEHHDFSGGDFSDGSDDHQVIQHDPGFDVFT